MSDDFLSRIDEVVARNARRFDPLGGEAWDLDRVEGVDDGEEAAAVGLIIGKPTSVHLDGIDLSGFVAEVGFELSPWQESILNALPDASTSLTFTGFWNAPLTFRGRLAPAAWAHFERLFELRRRRLSRMRSAYRARRR